MAMVMSMLFLQLSNLHLHHRSTASTKCLSCPSQLLLLLGPPMCPKKCLYLHKSITDCRSHLPPRHVDRHCSAFLFVFACAIFGFWIILLTYISIPSCYLLLILVFTIYLSVSTCTPAYAIFPLIQHKVIPLTIIVFYPFL